MPKISVIVPVYRVEKYIHRCVDSILGQSFSDFELILVDDGSPDNSGAVCDAYAEKDSRVMVIHQKNGGLSAARNAGIDWAFSNSDSQWLTFIDSDDWVHPEYLKRLLDAALENGAQVSACADVTTTGVVDLPEIKEAFQVWQPEDYYVQQRVLAIAACGKLYRKACFQDIRFPVGKLHEDEFTTYKILFAVDKIAVDPAPLYFYFVNEAGIMRSPWTPAKMAKIECLKVQLDFFKRNGYDRAYRYMTGQTIHAVYYTIGQIRKADLQDTHYRRLAHRQMQWYLLRYGKIANIRISNYCGYYEEAFPKFMKLYWYGLAALRKLGIRK